jgi:hypothetical protein
MLKKNSHGEHGKCKCQKFVRVSVNHLHLLNFKFTQFIYFF